MKRLSIALFSLLSFNATYSQSCSEQIKQLYAEYMKGGSIDQNLTDEMINKRERLINATNINPIIRAQDINDDAIETLSVRELSDDWYMVQYQWKKGDNNTTTEIPIKVKRIDGQCKITYITPIWNGNKYGDELLIGCKDSYNEVNNSSELSFIKSFYTLYVSEYCNMSKDLDDKLLALRQQYLSAIALEQYNDAAREEMKDYREGYDLLINGFDFDCTWCNSLAFKRLKENTYKITYNKNTKKTKTIFVKIR